MLHILNALLVLVIIFFGLNVLSNNYGTKNTNIAEAIVGKKNQTVVLRCADQIFIIVLFVILCYINRL